MSPAFHIKAHKKTRKRATRNHHGVYLVELLVAIAIGAALTLALLNTASISMRHATTTQNEVYANTIVRELLEATRASTYQDLSGFIGEHTLLTNKTSAGQIGPTLREAPVQLNTVEKTWNSASTNNKFRGEVKYTIEGGPTIDTLKVTVTVSWSDSMKYDTSNKREVSESTIVSKFGATYWNQTPEP